MKPRGLSSILADSFDTDLRAEVIAAELIENDVPAEQIMIVQLGSRKRAFRKDVDSVTDELSDYHNKPYTHIATHKEGIYDMLPEAMFHSPTIPKSARNPKEIAQIIKQHRAEERNARRFFLPFEAAISHLRIQMALYEGRLDKGAHHNELVDVFKGYWEIFKYLNTEQSNIFLQVLPWIHDLRDDHTAAAEIFQQILSLPVRIGSRRQRPVHPSQPYFSKMGESKLGIDLTTGNHEYDGGEDEIIVNIGPLTNGQLRKFMPGERDHKVLQLLSDYLLPIHIEVHINYELQSADHSLRLADKSNSFNSTLGLSTYL